MLDEISVERLALQMVAYWDINQKAEGLAGKLVEVRDDRTVETTVFVEVVQ